MRHADRGLPFDPNILFNHLIEKFDVKDDKGLSIMLDFPANLIRKLRYRNLPVSGSFLLHVSEKTHMKVADLRALMRDRRKSIRPSYRVIRYTDPNTPK